MLVPGDVLIMWGRITDKEEKGGMGLVGLEIGMKTQDGIESMPGTATVALPLRDGRRSRTPSCRRRTSTASNLDSWVARSNPSGPGDHCGFLSQR